MSKAQHQQFEGFAPPNHTQIPNQIIDFIMPDLSGNDFKVLLYIARRTLGFHKATDSIALSQIVSGMTTRDGRVLNRGTGLSKATVARCLNSLEEKGYITRLRTTTKTKGHAATQYTLKFKQEADNPLSQIETSPLVSKRDTPLSQIETHKTNIKQNKQQHVVVASSEETEGRGVTTELVGLLTKHSISKGVAHVLVKANEPEYLRNKVAYLEFLLSEQPETVKRPAAWLRSAIEKDYGKPDGFKSVEELERERVVEEERIAAQEAQKAAFEQLEDNVSELQRERGKAQNKRLRELQETHQVSEEDEQHWQQIVEQLTVALPGAHAKLLSHSYWIGSKDTELCIAMRSRIEADIVQKNLTVAILRILAGRGQQFTILKIIALDEETG